MLTKALLAKLENLSKKDLIIMVEEFEHYPSVTMENDKSYIIAYLDDEACTISSKQIEDYLS